MTNSETQAQSSDRKQYFTKQPFDMEARGERTPVFMALIYYLWVLYSAWSKSNSWSWNLEEGVVWTSGSAGWFFPIPLDPGMLAVLSPAFITDQIFYLIFMHGGLWILWIVLGVLYIFSPYRLNMEVVKGKLGK